MNKQKDCKTCEGQGYKFYTSKQLDKWVSQGGDYFNISHKCPDCENNSHDNGGVFPRI